MDCSRFGGRSPDTEFLLTLIDGTFEKNDQEPKDELEGLFRNWFGPKSLITAAVVKALEHQSAKSAR